MYFHNHCDFLKKASGGLLNGVAGILTKGCPVQSKWTYCDWLEAKGNHALVGAS
jgi:hypothetical protein